MKKISLAKSVVTVGLAAACAWSLAGCSGATGSGGGVAATVNGTEISEDEVTAMVDSVREQQSLSDEDSWGTWMAQYGYTPESVREEVLDGLINQEILLQKAGDRGVTVDDATVDENVESMKANYENDEKWQAALSSVGITEDQYRQKAGDRGVTVDDATVDENVESMKANYENDEKWQAALSSVGITEDQYRENIKLSLLYQGVIESFADDAAPTDEQLLTAASTYATYYDGAKRSSHILFDASDTETAQQVLDQINAGTLDFATAAEQYSKDTGSAAQGGDVGWDKLSSFVTEYTNGLKELSEGQVSGLVTSSYGIHIIKCTQVFNAPDEITSIDQIPSEFVETIRSMVLQQNEQTAYSDWLSSCRDSSDVVINDMPSGLSYYVDMSKYSSSSDTSGELGSEVSSSADSSDSEDRGSSSSSSESGDASSAENGSASSSAAASS